MNSTIGIGIIDYGYWGPNLARNFAAQDGARVAVIADGNSARHAAAARAYPSLRPHHHAFAGPDPARRCGCRCHRRSIQIEIHFRFHPPGEALQVSKCFPFAHFISLY